MNNELAVRKAAEAEMTGFEMRPRTFKEAMDFCELMANSDLVPDAYKRKPGNIMVAIQLGGELGLSPMRSLRCISVINGRASMFGDDMLAMVQASPVCEYVHEQESTEECGVCEVKRKVGDTEPLRSTFSLADAKRAGLLGKAGPWQQYTKRMLMLRARGFALRDKFSDVLAGLIMAEEALDIPQPKAELGEAIPAQTLKEKLKERLGVQETPHTTAEVAPGTTETTKPRVGDVDVIEPETEDILKEMQQAVTLPPIESVYEDWKKAPDQAAKSHIFNEAMELGYPESDKKWLLGKMKGKK